MRLLGLLVFGWRVPPMPRARRCWMLMGPFPACLPQRAHRYWSLLYTSSLVSWEGPVLLGAPFLRIRRLDLDEADVAGGDELTEVFFLGGGDPHGDAGVALYELDAVGYLPGLFDEPV